MCVRLAKTIGSLGMSCLAFTAVALAMGCSGEDRRTESPLDYVAPETRRIVTARHIDRPVDVVWSGLLEGLGHSPLRLLTQDASTRLLVAELRTGARAAVVVGSASRAAGEEEAETFVDCGRMRGRASEDGAFGTADFALAAASRHRESIRVANGFGTRTLSRTPALVARATIHLRPEGHGTRVAVNARYALTITSIGARRSTAERHGTDGSDAPVGRATDDTRVEETTVETARLTTMVEGSLTVVEKETDALREAAKDEGSAGSDSTGPARFERERDVEVVCRATGALERRLLALAEPEG